MKTLNIRQTREKLGDIDRLLAEEGEMVITRRGEEIARLVPISKDKPMPSHAALRKSMPRMRKGSEQMIRQDRNDR